MTGKRIWKKRTGPAAVRGSSSSGVLLRARYASTPKREPIGPQASPSISTGESLVTVKALRRSESPTKASVAAKTSAAYRARKPTQTASPETNITAATVHAAPSGKPGTKSGWR